MTHRLTRFLAAFGLIAVTGIAAPAKADVTLINVFEVPPTQMEATVAAWKQARDFLKQRPGYITTTLFKALGADSRFQLINVARWESPDAFKRAVGAMHAAKIFSKPDGVAINPALYLPYLNDED